MRVNLIYDDLFHDKSTIQNILCSIRFSKSKYNNHDNIYGSKL